MGAQPLAERVRRHQLLQLADELCVAAEREVGLDAPLEHGEALLGEPLRLVMRQALEVQPLQRLSAPQRERLPQEPGRRGGVSRQQRLRVGGEPLEHGGVELAGHEHVAAGPRDDPVRAEHAAQPRNVPLHRLGRARRRRLAP